MTGRDAAGQAGTHLQDAVGVDLRIRTLKPKGGRQDAAGHARTHLQDAVDVERDHESVVALPYLPAGCS